MSKQFNYEFQKKNNTNDSDWKTIKDYLRVLPDQDSIKKKHDGESYITRCPLSHNHKNGDRNPSFVINEVISNKYFDQNKVARNIVVYSCLSGCCNQRDLASFFKGRLDHG